MMVKENHFTLTSVYYSISDLPWVLRIWAQQALIVTGCYKEAEADILSIAPGPLVL